VEMDRQIRFDFYPIRYATTTKNRTVCCIPSEDCYQFRCLVNRDTMGVNSLSKTVTRQRRDCDLNPGRSAPESCTLHGHGPDTDRTRTKSAHVVGYELNSTTRTRHGPERTQRSFAAKKSVRVRAGPVGSVSGRCSGI